MGEGRKSAATCASPISTCWTSTKTPPWTTTRIFARRRCAAGRFASRPCTSAPMPRCAPSRRRPGGSGPGGCDARTVHVLARVGRARARRRRADGGTPKDRPHATAPAFHRVAAHGVAARGGGRDYRVGAVGVCLCRAHSIPGSLPQHPRRGRGGGQERPRERSGGVVRRESAAYIKKWLGHYTGAEATGLDAAPALVPYASHVTAGTTRGGVCSPPRPIVDSPTSSSSGGEYMRRASSRDADLDVSRARLGLGLGESPESER